MSLPRDTPYDLSSPALEPPAGVTPNFIDPYTRGPLLLALSTVAVGFMYLFVTARLYSKFRLHRKATWDDLTCTIAACGTTATFIALILVERAGFGRHQWDLRGSQLEEDSFLKPLYVLVTTTPLVALFTKLSFYIFFLQIFNPKPVLKWSIYVGICVTTGFYLATTIVLFVLTIPRSGDSLFPCFLNEKTSPIYVTTLAVGCFNVFSDLYILLLPISGVIRLKLPPRRKIGVILVFMTGLFACISSSVAFYYRYQINETGDATWNLMPAAYVFILEITIGIECSCMPACAVLLRHHRPLYTTLKSLLISRARSLTAHFSTNDRSSNHNQPPGLNLEGEVVVIPKLPEVSKGMHKMRTARSLIWGSMKHTTATSTTTTTAKDEEEEDGIYFTRDFKQSVSKV